MDKLLFLCHRIPFPPNKGDKVRAHHLLKFLASRYQVFLATFVDAPEDHGHVDDLKQLCSDCFVAPLTSVRAGIRGLSGLGHGEPLTVGYYRDRALDAWVRSTVRQHRIAKAVVFSSAMAQYVERLPIRTRLVDFVDVDSEKWRQYGELRSWPLSAVYRREAASLLRYERKVAGWADASLFVTAAEASLFGQLAPEAADRLHIVQNGVDSAFFSPAPDSPTPFGPDERAIVFTGAMDYWPNVDAARWYGAEVLPLVRAREPRARFYVVGNKPARSVVRLGQQEDVVVTGRVEDIRPYLEHASVVVAPLRIARGVQNKVLEAMAMGKAIVVSTAAAAGLAATPSAEIEVAGGAQEFADKTLKLLDSPRAKEMGRAARARALRAYSWESNLSKVGALLAEPLANPVRSRRDTPAGACNARLGEYVDEA